MGILYHRTIIYDNGKYDSGKEFLETELSSDEVYNSLMQKTQLYTLKSLNILPEEFSKLIDYNQITSTVLINAGRIYRINSNIHGLTPESILRMLKISKHEVPSLSIYKIVINKTETLFSITEEYTTYTGLKRGEKLKVKTKIVNYTSVSVEERDVLYFDRNEDVTKDIYEYFRNKYSLKSRNEFLMLLFEKNGKLKTVSFSWKLSVSGGKKITKKLDETYIWIKD